MLATSLAFLALAASPSLATGLDLGISHTTNPDPIPTATVGVHRVDSAPDASTSGSGKHRIPLLAAGLNWFVPGAGYLYNGEKPVYVSLPMVAGAVGLTYVEQFHQFEGGNLMTHDPTAFKVMFASVLVLNTGVAIDAFREARAINNGSLAKGGASRPL
jgi:hypothetical protein